jgi:predicted transglutaminase-like cysteine proteinase
MTFHKHILIVGAFLVGCGLPFYGPRAELFEPPASLSADLRLWPFGTAEEMIVSDPRKSTGMAFLRRAARDGFPRVDAWRPALHGLRDEPPLQQLSVVNALLNAVPYVADRVSGWTHPRVFLREGGDCDCAAVAKYLLLRDLGFPAKDLRIAVVKIRGDRRNHAVVVVRAGPGALRIFMLDNRSDAVRTALYADEYTPLISISEAGVWLHDERGAKIARHFINPRIRE